MEVDIKRLERLALLKLSDDEEKALSKDIEKIVGFFKQLDRIVLEGVEPLFHVMEKEAGVREDSVERGIERAWVERSAAKTIDGYVVGPRTITGEES
ncbi:MAG TPA: Asp-tRNA(Asn)/Glu-tRNA(Gln) amidotransferase subunit GatC [Sulfolobales archaeon]|nr:Asp-tRNA(Asn)/Glu-tRNA(Gln) amidotransferase subunit GatC [Sulfolobales archaeon]